MEVKLGGCLLLVRTDDLVPSERVSSGMNSNLGYLFLIAGDCEALSGKSESRGGKNEAPFGKSETLIPEKMKRGCIPISGIQKTARQP